MPPVRLDTTPTSPHSASHVIWTTRVPRCCHCTAQQKKSYKTQHYLVKTSRTPGSLSPVTTEKRHQGPADTGPADSTDLSTWKPNHVWARTPVVIPPRPVTQVQDLQRLLPWRTYWPPPRVGYRAESRARGDTGRWEPRGVSRRPPSSGQYASLPLPMHTTQELRNPARSGRSVLRHRAARAHSGRGGRTPPGCPASTSEEGSAQNL